MPYDFSNSILAPPVVRRNVFISHYHGHQTETDDFLTRFGTVFIPKTVGALGDQNYISSTNPEYVIQRIRGEYIGDPTVTIVLVGKCTHSRKFVDWEIKASLQQGEDSLPNGLIGIHMPSAGSRFDAPDRLALNWIRDSGDCYARCYRYPQSQEELRRWIEDAFAARTNRAKWIKNPHDTMFGYDRKCRICGITH